MHAVTRRNLMKAWITDLHRQAKTEHTFHARSRDR